MLLSWTEMERSSVLTAWALWCPSQHCCKRTPLCMAQNNLGIAEKLKHFFQKVTFKFWAENPPRILVGITLQAWRYRLEAADLDPQGTWVLSTKTAWFYTIPPACRGFGACFLSNSNLGAADHFCNADNMHKSFPCLCHHSHWQNSVIKFTVPPLCCSVCCYLRDEYQTLCRQLDFLCH